MGCFSGCLMSSASDQKLFCKLSSPFSCSFDEFVEEKVISPSYSSAILTPPPTISSSVIPFSSWLQSFPASGSFPMTRLFTSGGQSIGASASASVLPMNIQGWFPLWSTALISLLSEGFSRAFSSTTIQKHQFFGTQPSPTLTSIHDYQKNPYLWLYHWASPFPWSLCLWKCLKHYSDSVPICRLKDSLTIG